MAGSDTAEAPEGEQWSVENTVAAIPGFEPKINSPSPVPFFHILERLKTTPREGWRRKGITPGESIADTCIECQ